MKQRRRSKGKDEEDGVSGSLPMIYYFRSSLSARNDIWQTLDAESEEPAMGTAVSTEHEQEGLGLPLQRLAFEHQNQKGVSLAGKLHRL